MARSRSRALLAIAAATVVALAASANAGILTIGTTPPVLDGEDIAHLATGTGGEKLWTDTRAIGQTFTTGSQDVVLDAITLQSWSGSLATKNYTLTIGTVSGTSYSAFATESGIVQSVDSVANDYWTFTLDTPVTLSANTLYGFDLAMNSSSTGWQSGIPYRATTGDLYAGGRQFRSQLNGQSTPTIGYIGGDKVFHLNLEPAGGPPPPGPVNIPIDNFGFENPVLVNGDWNYSMDDQGWGYFGNDGYQGSWNVTTGDFPGEAPEGQNVGWTNPGDGVPGGFGQVLTDPDATLKANMIYTLTVEVGNAIGYEFEGYKVQLLAGGTPHTPGDGTDYTGPVTGGVLLAEDDNILTIADGTFETSIVTFICDAAQYGGLLGEPLQIRLLAYPGPDDTEVEFDNVRLTATLIPEPATLSLLGLGGLLALRRRRRSR